jgi:membrane-bound ClpP family serine protease
MTPLAWVAVLLLVGLVALALEVFVPSGGVLGFLSVVALIAGVALAFIEQGPWFGMAVLAVTCLAVPVVLGLAFQVFPHTPLGRRVLPPPPRPDEVVPDADRRAALRGLVGHTGLATTDLLPWGGVAIDGVGHEAVSEGGPIARGAAVEVVGTQAAALVVRAAAAPAARPAAPAPPEPTAVPRDLETALESFDFDALDLGSAPKTALDPGKLDSPETPNKA